MKYYHLISPDRGENIHMQRASHSWFYDTSGQYLNPNDVELPFLVNMYAGEESGYEQFDIDFYGEAEIISVADRLKDFYTTTPLMSDDLIKTILEAGVKNLQFFPVLIKDMQRGETVEKVYKFFNIIGLISCADMEGSRHSSVGGTYYFHDLAVNEANTNGELLFRLAEAPSEIIVAEKVAEAINKGGFRGIFAEPLLENI